MGSQEREKLSFCTAVAHIPHHLIAWMEHARQIPWLIGCRVVGAGGPTAPGGLQVYESVHSQEFSRAVHVQCASMPLGPVGPPGPTSEPSVWC